MNGTSLRSLSLAPHASFGWERGQSFQRPGRGRCHSASPPLEGEVMWGGFFFFFLLVDALSSFMQTAVKVLRCPIAP